jgi:hypothetical protein
MAMVITALHSTYQTIEADLFAVPMRCLAVRLRRETQTELEGLPRILVETLETRWAVCRVMLCKGIYTEQPCHWGLQMGLLGSLLCELVLLQPELKLIHLIIQLIMVPAVEHRAQAPKLAQ